MTFTILGFQVFNLNDYDVKLFAKYAEDQLYIAKFQLLDKYPDLNSQDEGSSQRFDKLQFTTNGTHDVLKNFPFSALFKSELTMVKPINTRLSNFVSLFNEEYYYLLNLYTDNQSTSKNIEAFLSKLGVSTIEVESFSVFITGKINELDEKIFKESLGKDRLQKRINPKIPREMKIISQHIKIIEDDESYAESYAQLFHEFDEEFIHSQADKFQFTASTTQKNI